MKFRFVSFSDTKALATKHPQLRGHFHLLPSDLERNPHITDDFPVFCYMLDGDQIASHFSSFPDRVYYQDREYNWAWCGNLFTNPAYRGKGIASALVKEQASLFHSKNLAWGGVFSTPEALRIYERLGFSVPGYASRYLTIKNLSPFLKHHFANSFMIRTAESAYGAFLGAARRILHDDRSFFNDYTIDAQEIGVTISKSELENIKYSQCYHFDDSEVMTHWKMRARNIDRLQIARSRRTGENSFYLLVRCREINNKALLGRYKGFKLMTAMDYGRFDLNPSISDAIVSGIMALFFASDADACEVVSSDKNICRSARRRGMMRIGKGMSFAYCLPSDWDFGARSADISQWHLTHYRGDAFAFE